MTPHRGAATVYDAPMADHVAILKWPYAQMILDGQKTVECRLTRTARAPYGCIKAGERIIFKVSSGPFIATAIASKVEFSDNLTPKKVASLRQRFNHAIHGDDAFWASKCDSRYATLIHLRDVKRTAQAPKLPPSRGRAWFVLDQARSSKSFRIVLTPGAIRNGYVRIPQTTHRFPPSVYGGSKSAQAGRSITLVMPDGHNIRTDILRGTMLRWRGWGGYFRDYQIHPGDAIRFAQLTPWRYRISFIEQYPGKRDQSDQPPARTKTGLR